MIEQVMIYEVKSAAAANAKKLFSNDYKYFYWNEAKFKNLNLGDYVFVVNKNHNWVIFSRLNKIDIPTTESGDNTLFVDHGKNFTVKGKWNKFVCLEILNKLSTTSSWLWKSLGSSEITYLNGHRINIESSKNRLKNINQLLALSQDKLYKQILENCSLNFKGNISKPAPIMSTKKTK